MHHRTRIRNAVVSAIEANNTVYGFFVFNFRTENIPKNKLPAISVYTTNEIAEKSKDECNYLREFDVHIVIYCSGTARNEQLTTGAKYADELIDDYIEYIENIFLKQVETLLGTVYRLNYIGCQVKSNSEETEDLIFIADTKWTAIVRQDVTND